jgi:hypothetical protein
MKHPVYLSKTKKNFFSKTENRKAKQVLSGGKYQWEGGRYKERI